jgi:hypothetical protein
MRARHQREHAHRMQGPAHQLITGSQDPEREVNVAALEQAGKPERPLLEEMHFNSRPRPEVAGQKRGERVLDHLGRGAHAQATSVATPQSLRLLPEALNRGQDVTAPGHEIFALRRQPHPAATPLEERHAQLPFEVVDLPRQARAG